MSDLKRSVEQQVNDLGINVLGEDPKRRTARHLTRDAAAATLEARGKLIPIPDPNADRARQRRAAAQRRIQRGGRTSTILSQPETLG